MASNEKDGSCMKILTNLKEAFLLWCNKPVYDREKALEFTLKQVLSKYVVWENVSREDRCQLLELFPEVVRYLDERSTF